MSTSPDRALPLDDPARLGAGLAHPMRLGPLGPARSAGPDKVEEAILIILGTGYGERVMRPDFGCNLRSLVFAPNNDTTAGLARFHVQEGLSRWEPRIEVLDVTVTNDLGGNRLMIDIGYRVRATRDVRTLVYPFSLERI